MASVMRWRYGETNPIMMPTSTDDVIEIGDTVWLDGDVARPASELAKGSLSQGAFHDAFLGVTMQTSQLGSNEPIRIATSGVFEFDCDPAEFGIGQCIGPANNQTSLPMALQSQKVVEVNNPALAIGRCVKMVRPAASKVLVDIVSTIIRGGVQAAER